MVMHRLIWQLIHPLVWSWPHIPHLRWRTCYWRQGKHVPNFYSLWSSPLFFGLGDTLIELSIFLSAPFHRQLSRRFHPRCLCSGGPWPVEDQLALKVPVVPVGPRARKLVVASPSVEISTPCSNKNAETVQSHLLIPEQIYKIWRGIPEIRQKEIQIKLQ